MIVAAKHGAASYIRPNALQATYGGEYQHNGCKTNILPLQYKLAGKAICSYSVKHVAMQLTSEYQFLDLWQK